MRRRLRSIRYKLFGGILLTTISALLISGIAMVLYDLQSHRERLVQDLLTQGRLLGLTTTPGLRFNDPKLAADSLALLEVRPQILAAAIYDAEGKLFATYSRAGYNGNFPPQPALEGQYLEGESFIAFQPIVDHGEQLGTVYIATEFLLNKRLWQYAGIVLAGGILALVISTLLSLWIQASITRPVLSISNLARRITQQRDYSLRADIHTNDEVGHLADSFNNLLSEVQQRSAEIQRLNSALEQRVAARTAELESINRELEAFSYSVSHDLRTPLRAIDGFSQALLEDYADQLDETAQDYLSRVRSGAQRMGQLIDDLLKLARVSRAPLSRENINLSNMATTILEELQAAEPNRVAHIEVEPQIEVIGDPQLTRIALDNLLGNAWKYTGKCAETRIQFGQGLRDGTPCYCVTDNGAGFDMAYVDKLFGAFQRLHDAKEYPGTGIGLATVQRIIHRHGGRIWADSTLGSGSTFCFTLPNEKTLQSSRI